MTMEYTFPNPIYYEEVKEHPRGHVLNNLAKHGVGIEIGVWQGGFSDLLLHWTEPKIMHLVDPWQPATDSEHEGAFYYGDQQNMDEAFVFVRSRFIKEIVRGQVVVWRAKSQDIVDQFEDDYFDWVYIDGDHCYDAVRADIELYLPKLKSSGWMVGDDYGAVHEWWGDDIIRAVQDSLNEHPELHLGAVLGAQFILTKD